MMPTRCASSSASSRYCVVKKMVMPSCSFSAAHLVPHIRSADRVEAGGRFVEEEDLRLVDQRHGQVESTLHAARVGLDAIVDGAADVDQTDDVVHPPRDVRRRQPVEPTLQIEQFAPGLFPVERRILESDTDAEPDGAGVALDVVAGHDRGARCRRQQRAEHLDARGLSGAVRAEEAVDLTRRDLEVDAGDRFVVFECPTESGCCDRCVHAPPIVPDVRCPTRSVSPLM